MTHEFDKSYWERHWGEGGGPGSMGDNPAHPYLETEVVDLPPGTALDAGAGAGAEAIWLARHGWRVTAADISAQALARAAERAGEAGVTEQIDFVEADLETWEPESAFDLVTTHYAHPTIPQLDFYDRIGAWVRPGGTLLVVGHLHRHDHGSDGGHGHGHGEEPPPEASVTAASVTARLGAGNWEVVTAAETRREVPGPGGCPRTLDDVVVRAVRR